MQHLVVAVVVVVVDFDVEFVDVPDVVAVVVDFDVEFVVVLDVPEVVVVDFDVEFVVVVEFVVDFVVVVVVDRVVVAIVAVAVEDCKMGTVVEHHDDRWLTEQLHPVCKKNLLYLQFDIISFVKMWRTYKIY